VPLEMNWVTFSPDLGSATRVSEELSAESVEARSGRQWCMGRTRRKSESSERTVEYWGYIMRRNILID
jgi:hypothetical protein